LWAGGTFYGWKLRKNSKEHFLGNFKNRYFIGLLIGSLSQIKKKKREKKQWQELNKQPVKVLEAKRPES
jgi:hypothetical protein